jgi:FlaA1/EpsC-like NDP-sugar epimerase
MVNLNFLYIIVTNRISSYSINGMKKILVTGAAGFIGSHLVEADINLRHIVIGTNGFVNE